MSKAHQVLDIKSGLVVITRDVNFDESALIFSLALLVEVVKDTALDFGSLTFEDEPRETDLRLAGEKLKD